MDDKNYPDATGQLWRVNPEYPTYEAEKSRLGEIAERFEQAAKERGK